jgi:hypothetical protein
MRSLAIAYLHEFTPQLVASSHHLKNPTTHNRHDRDRKASAIRFAHRAKTRFADPRDLMPIYLRGSSRHSSFARSSNGLFFPATMHPPELLRRLIDRFSNSIVVPLR